MAFHSNKPEGLVSQASSDSKRPSEAGLSGGSPEQRRPDIRSPEVGKRRKGIGSKGAKLPQSGGDDTRPGPNIPSPRNPAGSLSISLPPSGFLLSSGPPSGRAPGRNHLYAEPPVRPRARPPAGAKVSSCPQRKDAGAGLPGSSRAYLRDG